MASAFFSDLTTEVSLCGCHRTYSCHTYSVKQLCGTEQTAVLQFGLFYPPAIAWSLSYIALKANFSVAIGFKVKVLYPIDATWP